MGNSFITILNYPGSKKRLLNEINSTIEGVLPKGKSIIDLFCGTCAVGYSLKKDYRVIGNDAEIFCYEMAKALLMNQDFCFDNIKSDFLQLYNQNLNTLKKIFPEYKKEQELISECNIQGLVKFYKNIKTIFDDGYKERESNSKFDLFTKYYSNSYYGLYQCFEIDSIRYAIENYKDADLKSILFCCLYFAMKETVFSKDGHMAQPLNLEQNSKRLLKCRNKILLNFFIEKTKDFEFSIFKKSNYDNLCYNLTLDDILNTDIIKNVDLIYADPPYTDMQYSRYFHLLETVTKYDFPKISYHNGKVSSGKYRENRYQSPLSQRGKAKHDLEKLIKFCKENSKILIFSYAYPKNVNEQKTDRYTMSINDLIQLFYKYYGSDFTSIKAIDYEHSNNRNSNSKKVYEYLIIGTI